MGKFAFEPNYFAHCQMDFDFVFDKKHREDCSFDLLDELLLKLNYGGDENQLSIFIREEDDKVYAHKLLLKNNYCLCSFDYAFEPNLPISTYLKDQIKYNNLNIFFLYSKYALERYAETGSIYGNGKLWSR